jgi:hypothetical protein
MAGTLFTEPSMNMHQEDRVERLYTTYLEKFLQRYNWPARSYWPA